MLPLRAQHSPTTQPRVGPTKAKPLSAADKKRLDESPGKRALSEILNTYQICVTNCNDKVALAGWMAGNEIPVQTVLRSGHSLSQEKARDAAKNPSGWPPHPFSTLRRVAEAAANTAGAWKAKVGTATPGTKLGGMAKCQGWCTRSDEGDPQRNQTQNQPFGLVARDRNTGGRVSAEGRARDGQFTVPCGIMQ